MKRQGFNPSRTHGISKASTTIDEQSNKNAYANFEQDEIMIDFNIVYPSDCEIKVWTILQAYINVKKMLRKIAGSSYYYSDNRLIWLVSQEK